MEDCLFCKIIKGEIPANKDDREFCKTGIENGS